MRKPVLNNGQIGGNAFPCLKHSQLGLQFMSTATTGNDDLSGLTDAQLDEVLAHPYWESLGPALDSLISQIPTSRPTCERTTVLTWIYQSSGVMGFIELSDRITGFENITQRKKHIRGVLRGLEKLMLVSIVNFHAEEGAEDPGDANGVIGRNSMISLTWSGMVWMRRAWQARARLGGPENMRSIHQALVEEEDEGKANEPYWVENITSVDPDGAERRAQRVIDAMPAISSIFGLAQAGWGLD
jgi:hypothetical protein